MIFLFQTVPNEICEDEEGKVMRLANKETKVIVARVYIISRLKEVFTVRFSAIYSKRGQLLFCDEKNQQGHKEIG